MKALFAAHSVILLAPESIIENVEQSAGSIYFMLPPFHDDGKMPEIHIII